MGLSTRLLVGVVLSVVGTAAEPPPRQSEVAGLREEVKGLHTEVARLRELLHGVAGVFVGNGTEASASQPKREQRKDTSSVVSSPRPQRGNPTTVQSLKQATHAHRKGAATCGEAGSSRTPQFAVLVTGLLRTIENTWTSLMLSVVQPNSADVFLQMYLDREVPTTWRASGMQEDAENMNYAMFIDKYGVANIDIWRDYHDPNYENTNVDEYMSEGMDC